MIIVKVQILLIAFFAFILAEFLIRSEKEQDFDGCTRSKTCNECLQTYGCAWCSELTLIEGRCQNETQLKCDSKFVTNPEIGIVKEKTVNASTKANTNKKNRKNAKEEIIRVSPQSVTIKMRRNEGHPFRIMLRYHQAANYPLDIYYLQDMSILREEKEQLYKPGLGRDLERSISRLTNNLRLGYGGFAEKPSLPFVSNEPEDNVDPCENCVPTFNFRNYISLGSTKSFGDKIRSFDLSGDMDKPTAGFDGIMQAITCRQQIGWQENRHKLLLYSTNNPFHIAGDGKLGGILKPNDGCCHLDENGFYNYSTIQDYPSIAQINEKVKENSVNIIFVVPENYGELYRKLTTFIDGSFLEIKKKIENTSGIIRIITERYKNITSTVELRENNVGEHLKVKYYSRCLNSRGPLIETNKCNQIKINDTVEFEIHIELISCPTNRKDWNHQFFIQPIGVSERMMVNINMTCDCECDKPGNHLYQDHSSTCSNHGTLKCGICECDQGYSGINCDCPYDENEINQCLPNQNSALCSNRGSCICNQCQCDTIYATEGFWGQYCQCNNFTCPYMNGKLCSGNGNCICNECVCNEGWIDDTCSCKNSTENCVRESYDEICSGNGDCVCNKCECRNNSEYSGKYCDEFMNSNTKCDELKDCVLCVLSSAELSDQKPCMNSCTVVPEVVESIEDLITAYDYIKCRQTDERNNDFYYAYEITGTIMQIVIQKHKDSQLRIPATSVGLLIVSVIVGSGIACLMIWKTYATIQDKRTFSPTTEITMLRSLEEVQLHEPIVLLSNDGTRAMAQYIHLN